MLILSHVLFFLKILPLILSHVPFFLKFLPFMPQLLNNLLHSTYITIQNAINNFVSFKLPKFLIADKKKGFLVF